MAATTKGEIDIVPVGERQADAGSGARAKRVALNVFSRVWQARGFVGGLIAIGLGLLGQQSLVTGNDPQAAFRYYSLAMIVLVLSLIYPNLGWVERVRTSITARRRVRGASETADREIPAPKPGEQEAVVDKTQALAPSDTGNLDRVETVDATSTLIARRARSNMTAPLAESIVEGPTIVETVSTGTDAKRERVRPWKAYTGLRSRLGWRATVPGLALAGILAIASFVALQGNPASVQGGWLWAAALFTLLLATIGAPPWPREEGRASLLPGPMSDFFGRGLPLIPAKLEAVLVGAILLVGAFMRVFDLEYMPGIFGDEGERGMDARAINEGATPNLFGYGWWGVPNLYFYIISGFMRVFGDNMFGARMLSVVSGLLTVWFIYKTGRLLWGARAGLIAGALVAVSPVALQFSRQAGESTPTGMLWAGGFYFFFMALRHRRWSDWTLAGLFWGFSLYFYAAGKLIIPLVAIVAVYCLVRWHINFFKQHALGWALLGVAFLLTFMPYGLRSARDGWTDFTGRATETSIFSPSRQAEAFGKYGIAFTPPKGNESLASQVLSNPGPWIQLISQQLRVTTEVLYRTGDPTVFFQIRENGGALLAPIWAVLVILGLAYGLSRVWDPRFGIVSLWFWGGIMGTALTMDTPSVQRMVGAWPVMMLFPAVLIDRVVAASWPLNLKVARVWLAAPIAALLVFFASDSYRTYFEHYRSLCPFCDATTQARYAQSLGQDYKGYQLGVGSYDTFFNYGSTRFAAKGVMGTDLSVPVDYLPVTDDGKGAAFLVLPNNYEYLPLIRLIYPQGTEETVRSPDGSERFRAYKVTRESLAETRRVEGVFTMPDGSLLVRPMRQFGLIDEATARWANERGVRFPTKVEWRAGVYAPAYGAYTLAVGGAGAQLEVDGRAVLDGSGQVSQPVDIVLAKGLHEVRLSATVSPEAQLPLQWSSDGGTPVAIPSRYIYNGPTGGLSGEFAPLGSIDALRLSDPLSNTVRIMRRSDAFFGFRAATDSVGSSPFIARYTGEIEIPADGSYNFETVSNGPSVLLIDGTEVVNNISSGNPSLSNGQVTLDKGRHTIDLRYAWASGRATLELYWTRPGGQRELVPPTVLIPAKRSWPRSELPDAPLASVPQAQPSTAEMPKREPVQVMGGLNNPRGLAVDSQGNVYVGDRGNGRIVVFGPDGNEVRSWGKAAPQGSTPGPGEFVDVTDVAVGPEGTVYVSDYNANRIQVFSREGQLKAVMDASITQVGGPNGLGVSPDGKLYIASTSQSVVVRLPNLSSITEETKTQLSEAPYVLAGSMGPGKLDQTLDVVINPQDSNQVFVADVKSRILQLDAEGKTGSQWDLPVGLEDGGARLAFSADGMLVYMTDPERNRVAVLDPKSGTIAYFGNPGSEPGQLKSPTGIATGPDGKIYVLDRGNGRVQVFAP